MTPPSESAYDVIFLTAAEVPTLTNVSTSQVMEVLVALKARGINSEWVSVLPMQTMLRRNRRAGHLEAVDQRCQELGLRWTRCVFGSRLFDSRMLPMRRLYARIASRLILARLRGRDLPRRIVINARSYYATAVGVELANILRERGHDVVLGFDMRGLLSLSYPASASGNKFSAYGTMKAWEAELACGSDVIYNNRSAALDIFEREYGLQVVHLPVSGFSENRLESADFDARWADKKVAFVGSITGKFHDTESLTRQLKCLEGDGFQPVVVTTDELDADFTYPALCIDHSEIPEFYSSCLGIVLPGRDVPADFFDRIALRIYSAPTKVSEALSSGVPIIVSSCFEEIADFVRQHQCGLVYDMDTDRIDIPDGSALDDPELWRRLSDGARRVGTEFTRERVTDIYLDSWNSAFDRSRAAEPTEAERASLHSGA
jgi:hypothetical protein